MKKLFCAIIVSLAGTLLSNAQDLAARMVEHRKIWDQAPHNAFTDIIRFKGKWFCVFREGSGHVSPDGMVRVLTTDNGLWWEPAARLQMDGLDLRDPKVSVSPDGKYLVVVAAAAAREGAEKASMTQSIVARSKDGWEWEKVSVIGAPNYWLWRITWHGEKAYGVAYATGHAVDKTGDHHSMLFSSRDGAEFEVMIPDFRASRSPRPTEATLRFDQAGNMICLHRRDGEKPTALLGFGRPPYSEFVWRDLGSYFGGPNFIQLPSGQWVACGRMKNVGPKKETKTVLCQLYLDAGTLEPLLTLPSGGDSSYPGLQWHDGRLWISYYSSHEGKASIYLAKVEVK